MDNVDHAAFRRLDLNLLVAFDALLVEGNVTRAAARLCIGQPAMSHALARLRELFGDDILYRDGAAMRPSTRALALAPRVRALLEEIQSLAKIDEDFDVAKISAQFRMALNDPLEALLLPGLVARLRLAAPGLTLAVRPISASQQLAQLDAGEIQLATGYFPQLSSVHDASLLHRTSFCCIYNPALLTLPEHIDLQCLTQYPHIHTTYTGDSPGLLDRLLQEHGLQRQIVAYTATPLSIPFVVKQSPLIAVLPELVTRLFSRHSDLCIRPLLIEGMSFPISMVAHRRDHSDPLTRFVMEQVRQTVQALLGEVSPSA